MHISAKHFKISLLHETKTHKERKKRQNLISEPKSKKSNRINETDCVKFLKTYTKHQRMKSRDLMKWRLRYSKHYSEPISATSIWTPCAVKTDLITNQRTIWTWWWFTALISNSFSHRNSLQYNVSKINYSYQERKACIVFQYKAISKYKL